MRFKSALPYVPGAVIFLVESGLQVSGISNIALAVTLWGAAAFLTILAAWYSLKENWMLQWPITKRSNSGTTFPTPVVSFKAALYVCDIRFTFGDLEKDRHSEISMRVFNGTGRTVEYVGLSGNVKFGASNLPTPSPREDMLKMATPFHEWLLILSQRIPAAEADALLAMLEADTRIEFDLNHLVIDVCARDDRQNVVRLPIWNGVSYSRGRGFGQNISLSARSG